MTIAAAPSLESLPQHIVLEGMSWEFYEQLLREIGDGATRVTYDEGRMEIMSPLPKHEFWGQWIGRLIEIICLDRSIEIGSAGSTTFRNPLRRKGLEPDKCFYIQNVNSVRDMEDEFDPAIHPAPDLAIEIDITSRSIDREPIYAALRVPELWRFDGTHLHVLHLTAKQKYAKRSRSLAFPFLPIEGFERFVLRRKDKNQIRTLSDFRDWVKSL